MPVLGRAGAKFWLAIHAFNCEAHGSQIRTAEFSVSDGRESHWGNFVTNDVFLGGFQALEESFS